MLSLVTHARFFPRTAEERSGERRTRALQAAVGELKSHMERLEHEQQIQLQRIAQLQADIDELKRMLQGKKGTSRTRR